MARTDKRKVNSLCSVCGARIRTRTEVGAVCGSCRQSAIDSLKSTSVDGNKYIDLARVPEAVLQQLVFSLVCLDGFPNLGYGPLSFVHHLQKSGRKFGKWIDGSREYDLLLRSNSGIVCLELKRKADRAALIQALDYKSYLTNNKKTPGDVKVALITMFLDKDFEALMRESWKSGLDIDLFCVDTDSKGIFFRRVGPELDFDP